MFKYINKALNFIQDVLEAGISNNAKVVEGVDILDFWHIERMCLVNNVYA